MALKVSIQSNQADLKSIKKKLEELKEFGKHEVKKILTHEAKQTVGRMKKAAPVDTGRLRRNIEQTIYRDDIVIESEAIDPQTGKDYAVIQEYGLSKFIKYTPYFRKNVRGLITNLNRRLKRRLKELTK